MSFAQFQGLNQVEKEARAQRSAIAKAKREAKAAERASSGGSASSEASVPALPRRGFGALFAAAAPSAAAPSAAPSPPPSSPAVPSSPVAPSGEGEDVDEAGGLGPENEPPANYGYTGGLEAVEEAGLAEEAKEPEEEPLPDNSFGVIGQWLKGTIDFLRDDDYLSHYRTLPPGEAIIKTTEPYRTIKRLYDTTKVDDSQIEASKQQFRALQLTNPDCSRDINLTLKPICEGIKASLFFTLHDIRDSVARDLRQEVANPPPVNEEHLREATEAENQGQEAGGFGLGPEVEEEEASSEVGASPEVEASPAGGVLRGRTTARSPYLKPRSLSPPRNAEEAAAQARERVPQFLERERGHPLGSL